MSEAEGLSAQFEELLKAGQIDDAAEAGLKLVSALRVAAFDPRQLADVAERMAVALRQAGALAHAEAFYEECARASEQVGQPERVATCWNKIGVFRQRRGDLAGAAVAMRCSADRFRALGATHMDDLERVLDNMAQICQAADDIEGLGSALEELVPLLERRLGPDNPLLAHALHDLARGRYAARSYEAAAEAARRALTLSRAAFGDSDPRVAAAENAVGMALIALGRHTEAEPLLDGALASCRRALSLGNAMCLPMANNLAQLRKEQGRYREAMELLEDALASAEQAQDVPPQVLSTLLASVGGLALDLGDTSRAIAMFERATDVDRVAFSDASPQVAQDLYSVGIAYATAGRHADALSALKRSAELRAKDGRAHWHHEETLRTAGRIALDSGDARHAESLLVMADQVVRRFYSTPHPAIVRSVHDLATVSLARGRFDEAERMAKRALKTLDACLPGATPLRADVLITLARSLTALSRHDEALAVASEVEDIHDGFIGQVFSSTSDRARTEFLTSIRDGFATYMSALVASPASGSSARARAAFELVLRRKGLGVEAFAAQREAVLAGRSPTAMALLGELRSARHRLVSAMLENVVVGGRDAAAWANEVERLEAELAQELPELTTARRWRDVHVAEVAAALPADAALIELVDVRVGATRRYLAFVLVSGDVSMIDLGEASAIDELVAAHAPVVRGGRDFGGDDEAASFPASDDSAALSLRRLVLDPVLEAVGGKTRLFIAPDGALSTVSFAALPDDAGALMIAKLVISYVTTGRELTRFGESCPPAGVAVVIAAPDYGEGDEFEPLPGTRDEGIEVAARLHVDPWLDADPTKSRFVACTSPRILHVATHGFVLPDAEETPSGALRRPIHDPMVRSGLALVGANDGGGGIVTALDISAMDLRGTTLVVLSACETGLGTSRVGEGIFGLRRALSLAGARTHILTLWKIPDEATRALMSDLYIELLAGRPCSDALAAVQRTRAVRGDPPSEWAAFLCFADPSAIT